MSDAQSFPAQTMAEIEEQTRKIRAQLYPEAKDRIEPVALRYAERCAEQAAAMGELCAFEMVWGYHAGHLAQCAWRLAHNSIEVLKTGWNMDEYNQWLAERLPETVAKVQAIIAADKAKRRTA